MFNRDFVYYSMKWGVGDMAELLEVLRTEKKYPMRGAAVYGLCVQLRQTLPLDKYCADGNGYLVRSLYFDSFTNTDFFEKEAGLECRKKIRLRTYGDGGMIKLEWKQKQGRVQRKRSLPVSADDARELSRGHYRCLLGYPHPLAQELYTYMVSQAYVPRCTVQYQRLAFVAAVNDTRITVDSRLCCHEGAFDILRPNPPLYPVAPPDAATLEVKYNQFLPSYIKLILSPFQLTEVTNSKYFAARRFGLGGTIV